MPEVDDALSGWIKLGYSTDLIDGGTALCFQLADGSAQSSPQNSGLVVRHEGSVHAYVNRCAHLALEMDWQPGRFFDLSGLYLICAVHGALFKPQSGLCIDGPCRGRRLQKLNVIEHQGTIYWQPDRPSAEIPFPPT